VPAIFVTAKARVAIFDQKHSLERGDKSLAVVIFQLITECKSSGTSLAQNPRLRSVMTMKKTDPSSIKLLTLAEAASILKISKRTLHRMIQNRQIPAFKVGGQWRILESRFQEWVQEEENTTPKAS
jgi:excisionase family DNA binding protein